MPRILEDWSIWRFIDLFNRPYSAVLMTLVNVPPADSPNQQILNDSIAYHSAVLTANFLQSCPQNILRKRNFGTHNAFKSSKGRAEVNPHDAPPEVTARVRSCAER
jgi:hypothetical protein